MLAYNLQLTNKTINEVCISLSRSQFFSLFHAGQISFSWFRVYVTSFLDNRENYFKEDTSSKNFYLPNSMILIEKNIKIPNKIETWFAKIFQAILLSSFSLYTTPQITEVKRCHRRNISKTQPPR